MSSSLIRACVRPLEAADGLRTGHGRRLRCAQALGGLVLVLGLVGGVMLGGAGRLSAPWGEASGRVDPDCRLERSPCEARYDEGRMRMTLSRVSRAPSAPVRFRLVFSGREPRAVTLELNGATMNMGPNMATLVRQSDGSWSGELPLSACISGAMTWAVVARAEVGAGAWTARFLFESGS